jgi:PilZ domain
LGDTKAMDNQDKEEHRKYERYHFREDISIDGTRCTCMDISESGIYVAAQYFATGDVVDVTFPFKGRNITIKGQVQHGENGVGVGIDFIDVNDDDRAIIKRLIHSISKTSVSYAIKDVDNGSQISLSIYEQNVILEALITLLNKKQIISDEELLSELKKKTSGNQR